MLNILQCRGHHPESSSPNVNSAEDTWPSLITSPHSLEMVCKVPFST